MEETKTTRRDARVLVVETANPFPLVESTSSGQEVVIKAPVKNIFQSLTDEEYAHVTAYLHEQKDLNLTAVVNSTS